MKQFRSFALVVASIVLGSAAGIIVTQYLGLLGDFPRAMTLRSVIAEAAGEMRPADALRLMDIYEIEVNRQSGFLGFSKFDWNQELLNLYLHRYVLYTKAQDSASAEKALVRAASMRKRGGPTNSADIEFERQIANRTYSTTVR